ncbi:MAG: GNAT family N-acetyltransferase [Massiliimalia sp.]|jgi:GNAT superfamily N-acetyltransferase
MAKTFAEIGQDKSLPHIGVIMEKRDTQYYPHFELPRGFHFHSYQPGYEEKWAQLEYEVEGMDTLEEARGVFYTEFLLGQTYQWLDRDGEEKRYPQPEQCPYFEEMRRRMVFVMDDRGELTGIGALWPGWTFGREDQRLHWIAVKPKYQGLGIAKAIVSKLLDLYNDMGYSGYLYLASQTWSYKALRIYYLFGFEPYLGEKPQRWISADFTTDPPQPWDYKQKNEEAWTMIRAKWQEYDEKRSSEC